MLNCHGERLYRVLVRLTLREDVAEDLLQDLVVKLAKADGFAAADDAYAYARRASVNLAFSWIRERGRERRHVAQSREPVAGEMPPWSRLVEVEEVRRVVERMQDLSERERMVVAMRYFDQAAYEDIAREIGATCHQARALCHKAIRRLRADLGAPARPVVTPTTEVKP